MKRAQAQVLAQRLRWLRRWRRLRAAAVQTQSTLAILCAAIRVCARSPSSGMALPPCGRAGQFPRPTWPIGPRPTRHCFARPSARPGAWHSSQCVSGARWRSRSCWARLVVWRPQTIPQRWLWRFWRCCRCWRSRSAWARARRRRTRATSCAAQHACMRLRRCGAASLRCGRATRCQPIFTTARTQRTRHCCARLSARRS